MVLFAAHGQNKVKPTQRSSIAKLAIVHRLANTCVAWLVIDARNVPTGGAVEVSALCAHPAFKGAGQLLLVAVLTRLISRPHHGIHKVALQPDNKKLRDKHKAIGFQPLKQGNRKKPHMWGAALFEIATVEGAKKVLQPWSRNRDVSARCSHQKPKPGS